MPELRKDYFLDRWVIIAKERGKRPHDYIHREKSEEFKKEEGKICFFCPGNEHTTPPEISRVVGENGNWIIRNFPNKFPATKWHEIVVETPIHGEDIANLSIEHLVKVFNVFSERVKEIEKNPEVKYVLIFKNSGKDAGASLQHSHTQLIGMEILPPFVKEEIIASEKYFKEKKICPYCDIIKKEVNSERKIFEDDHTIGFAPFASRFPFEFWLMPKRHITKLDEFQNDELYSFVKALKEILLKIQSLLNKPPYNFYIHISPKNSSFIHLHLVFFPRLTKFAGFEFGSGIPINIFSPEDAAKFYKDDIKFL